MSHKPNSKVSIQNCKHHRWATELLIEDAAKTLINRRHSFVQLFGQTFNFLLQDPVLVATKRVQRMTPDPETGWVHAPAAISQHKQLKRAVRRPRHVNR